MSESFEDEEIRNDKNDDAKSDNNNFEEDQVFEGKYQFLKKDKIDKERENKIEELMQFTDLPKVKAELVLINNKWNIDIIMNDWFDNMQKIKENSGIAQTTLSQTKLDEYFKTHEIHGDFCLICETKIEPGDAISLECNHQFCSNCFREYLNDQVKDQLTLLSTKCPMQYCNFQVHSDIFKKIF